MPSIVEDRKQIAALSKEIAEKKAAIQDHLYLGMAYTTCGALLQNYVQYYSKNPSSHHATFAFLKPWASA